MATVEVEVEIDEFNTDELVSEVVSRIGSKWDRLTDSHLKDLREAIGMERSGFNTPSLRESMKYDHLQEVFEQYSLEEIQELLPNKIMRKVI
ncbi:hypothetical protein [Salinimicrobium sp. GXAS 041]|uniref:hypothetical protein n=1 Tax=Salinimicrobium sp. GXAS 041 TaxID=3400806 RepID=UPI003C76D38E